MELKAPVFNTKKERNEYYAIIQEEAYEANNIEELENVWIENKYYITEIKKHDEEVYGLLIEFFRKRKNLLTQMEQFYDDNRSKKRV